MKRFAALATPAVIKALAVPAALIVGATLVVGGSNAAFTGATANPGNSWTSGTVALTNDHGSALFSAVNVVPGYTESHCITVSSTANAQTALQFYAEQTANTKQLAENIDLTVQAGSGGTDGVSSCTGFVQAQELFTGKLSGLAAANGTLGTALNVTAPLAAAGSQQFKITASLPASTPNAQQGGTAGVTFNWASHS